MNRNYFTYILVLTISSTSYECKASPDFIKLKETNLLKKTNTGYCAFTRFWDKSYWNTLEKYSNRFQLKLAFNTRHIETVLLPNNRFVMELPGIPDDDEKRLAGNSDTQLIEIYQLAFKSRLVSPDAASHFAGNDFWEGERRDSFTINEWQFDDTANLDTHYLEPTELKFVGNSNKSARYEKIKDGVIFKIGKAKLKITVCNETIMQVNYTLADTFSTKKSLILDGKKWPETKFSISEKNHIAEIATRKMKALVNTETGQVSFYDFKGNLLLKEKKDGKTITPIIQEGFKTNEITARFESSPDEAIYGLGQHQDRLLDIKGYDLDLFQRNTEVYIPFFVSTKGYGLLWHNYAYTKFGNPDAIKSIPQDQLYSNDERQGGLTTNLFADSAFEKPLQSDTSQAGVMLSGGENKLINGVKLAGFIQVKKSGDYLFYSYADGTFQLSVDDKLVINNWAPYANARDMGRVYLEAGKKYKINLAWKRFGKNNSFKLKMRAPEDNNKDISLWSQSAQEINYYVFAGNSMDDLIAGYREATGAAALLPKYAMGFWQSRERYKTQQELLDVVKEFRTRQVPIDVIVQDWQYWGPGQWGSDLFDSTRFPDAKGMIDTLHQELNTKFMISVWGKFYSGTDNFKELNKHHFLYQNPLKDSIVDFLGYHYTYYDAYNPEARKMYWNQINKKLFSKGVDSWWLDASEPELPDSGPTPELMAKYMNPTYYGPGLEYLNAYPLFHTKGIYEGQRTANSNKRVCILTRSAFAGQQRYATTIWSGDIAGEWGNLKASIPAGLGFSLSGMPYWTTDAGGFWVKYPEGNKNKEYQELFTRWYQFAAFCPIFRVHGSNTEREIWYFGDKNTTIYQTQLKFNQLRYRLMPYIYSLAGMVTQKNYTIMRALVMDFQHDKNVWDIKDQYMFGSSILVNPVTEYQAKKRSVYLPECNGWYDFWTSDFYKGEQTIDAATPIESMPLYVKAGSIIPLGPNLQYATEKPANPIELRVYTGDDGKFTLYEDEDDNYNYEKGAFSLIPFIWNEQKQTLTIEARKGTFPGMLKQRNMQVVFIDKSSARSATSKTFKTIIYSGKKITIQKIK